MSLGVTDTQKCQKASGSGVGDSACKTAWISQETCHCAFLSDLTHEPDSQIGKSLFLYIETIILKRETYIDT